MALKTGFAWIEEHDHEKARKAYEGDPSRPGEGIRNPYLRRAFPSFKALFETGVFESWAHQLLEPLHQMILHQEDRGRQRG